MNTAMNCKQQLKEIRSAERSEKSSGFLKKCGEFFRDRRLKSGMSAESVADYLGVSVEWIESFEAGRTALPLDCARALSNCLNISPVEVMELFHGLR
jgi:ribosome-binding protein aMBF1 (putative translation factor)